jgi:hypothetical protein
MTFYEAINLACAIIKGKRAVESATAVGLGTWSEGKHNPVTVFRLRFI